MALTKQSCGSEKIQAVHFVGSIGILFDEIGPALGARPDGTQMDSLAHLLYAALG